MHLLAFALLALQAGAVAVVVAQTPPQSPAAVARPDSTARDSSRRRARRPVRRQPVTPELERTAFADARARTLLERARAARLAQDSALRAYDAKAYQRLSFGVGFRRIARDRLLLRTEQSARVRWARGSDVVVEPTGRRSASSMVATDVDLTPAVPIPYFPGRESLWLPLNAMGRVARSEVNENELLHPLATGAEAYYRYATGDSLSFRLPDGRMIALRELRITARRPTFRAFVGSFWFDVERGHLVRAAYRSAAEMDIWQSATEELRRDLEEARAHVRTDTSAAARAAVRDAERALRKDDAPWWVKGMVGPARAKVSAITVEYGLHEGRFWLPRRHVAEGEAQVSFMRMPVKVEERFQYNSVNGSDAPPAIPEAILAADDTSWAGGGSINIGATTGGQPQAAGDTSAAARAAREDSLIRRYTNSADSLRAAAERARAKGDTSRARQLAGAAQWNTARIRHIMRRREACSRGDSAYYAGRSSDPDGAFRMVIRMPCDTSRFATSRDLPPSIYEPGEELLASEEVDELLATLDFSLQSGWAPQPPVLRTGLDLVRYNRIEGLSVGGSATSQLGMGYTARAVARIGAADWVPNGELSLARSNLRSELRVGVFHRLGVANDDWGAPLSFGASVANLLYARDEGFYYRTWGAELSGARDAPGPLGGATLSWRLFAERQRSAGHEPNTQASLGNAIGDTRFERNIDAVQLTALGLGGELARTFGADPAAIRLDSRVRAEGAFTDRSDAIGATGYARLVIDGTLSRGFGRFAAAMTGAAGAAAGDLPPQRTFYIGGLHTVRGQFARREGEGRVGDAFWLGRAELGLGRMVGFRPAIFYDVGWAGPRAEFARPGHPLSGAGAGLSLLDGLVRFDVARGIWPEKRWRVDLYLEARF
ncbi:MAG: hypothetical protein ABR499_17250 [Gemmatimonadaceae bacterium]